jgi:hypothetical protein
VQRPMRNRMVPNRDSRRGWAESTVFGNTAFLKCSLLTVVPISSYAIPKTFGFRLDFTQPRYFHFRGCVPACHWSAGAATLSACRGSIADYSRGPLPGQII